MPYTQNPFLPKLRMEAILRVATGESIRSVARYYGVHPSTILKWTRKATPDGRRVLKTGSARPHTHPQALPQEPIQAILRVRTERKRCAEVVHAVLVKDGVTVSLSSVKRVLKRYGMLRERSPETRRGIGPARPFVASVGDLVEVDTVHIHPLRDHP